MVSARSVNGGCPAPVWPSVQPPVSILSKLTYFLFPCHTVASVNISARGCIPSPVPPVSVAPTSPGTSSGGSTQGCPFESGFSLSIMSWVQLCCSRCRDRLPG